LGRRGAEGIVLGDERDVSEEIESVPVAERPQEPRFRAVEVDVRAQRRIGLARESSLASVLWRRNSFTSMTW